MSVFLNNIDDYLGPSQACVNPLFTAPSKSQSTDTTSVTNDANSSLSNTGNKSQGVSEDRNSDAVVQSKRRIRRRPPPRIIHNEEDANRRREPIRLLHNSDDGYVKSEPHSIDINPPSTKKKTKATVTLSDCLSCSGCVTSAEAVLMSHHSVDKFRDVAKQSAAGGNRIVFTISPASLADLHRHIYLASQDKSDLNNDKMCGDDDCSPSVPSRHDFLQSITNFLHSQFGVAAVIDGSVTQRISLLESANELCYRYRQQQQQQEKEEKKQSTLIDSDCEVTSLALSSTQTRYIKKKLRVNGSAILEDDTMMDVTVVDHPPGLLLPTDDDCSVGDRTAHNPPSLPMLASSCPGFVCLVEKTASSVVPLLSSAKSPMSVAGTLLKSGLLSTNNNDLSEPSCFHVAVMPCHDKKLEAGRNDFAWEKQTLLKYARGTNINIGATNATATGGSASKDIVNEVDLVLTTGELLEILTSTAEQSGKNGSGSSDCSIQALLESTVGQMPCLLITDAENSDCSDSSTTCHEPSNVLGLDVAVHGSGSYADFIFRYAALELFGCELSQTKPLPWKGSNPSNAASDAPEPASGVIRRRRRRQDTTDLRSITLYKHKNGSYSCTEDKASIPVLSFATAYGFKNVQLILQNLSKDGYTSGALNAKGYDYVEVMACPSGCPNGGGQIGAVGKRETPKETKERVKRTVSNIPIIRPDGGTGTVASSLFDCYNTLDTDLNSQQKVLNGGFFGESARRLLHTQFHAVPKLELSTGATAGVAVNDTKW